jgi:hypothetical protein
VLASLRVDESLCAYVEVELFDLLPEPLSDALALQL